MVFPLNKLLEVSATADRQGVLSSGITAAHCFPVIRIMI
jgi:hypothetical protein